MFEFKPHEDVRYKDHTNRKENREYQFHTKQEDRGSKVPKDFNLPFASNSKQLEYRKVGTDNTKNQCFIKFITVQHDNAVLHHKIYLRMTEDNRARGTEPSDRFLMKSTNKRASIVDTSKSDYSWLLLERQR